MKIAFVVPCLWFGGAERVISILANDLVKNHEIHIIITGEIPDIAYQIDGGVHISNIHEKSTLKTWRNLRKKCRQNNIDVAIAFMTDIGTMTSLALAFTKVKVIVSERNDPSVEDRQRSLVVKVLRKIARFFISGYVFQSEGAKSYYSKSCQRKSRIILNPLDCNNLPERNCLEIDNRIVTVGRLQPQKNHKMLIDAFSMSKAKDTHTLHIYGEGFLRQELETQISELNLNGKVFLEGNSKTVHEDIKQAKLFAFTSDYEGLPNALIEAMAIGIPCVSTDCSPGGARMLIDDGENGVLISCGDTNRLAAIFDELLENENLLYQFSMNGQKIKEKVSVKMISDSWMDFICRIVKQ